MKDEIKILEEKKQKLVNKRNSGFKRPGRISYQEMRNIDIEISSIIKKIKEIKQNIK